LGVERFLAEIRTTAQLRIRTSVAALHDADWLLFYVMPYVTGEVCGAGGRGTAPD
jgi:hypothetical protein